MNKGYRKKNILWEEFFSKSSQLDSIIKRLKDLDKDPIIEIKLTKNLILFFSDMQ